MGKTKAENIIGKQIGIFEVMYECDFKSNDGHRMFHVKCSKCGKEQDMQMHQIKYPKVCNHVGAGGEMLHGGYEWENKRIGNIFKGIKRRCYNIHDKSYRWYGAKGITICKEWIDNPILFEQWSFSNGYADDLTIDRIDSNKNYSPENCRWVNLDDNAKYKSTTVMTEVNGESHTGREWAEILDVGTNVINTMLREHGEETTRKFIAARAKDMSVHRKSHQTWLKAYGLE